VLASPLRDKAQSWWDNLTAFRVDNTRWEPIKRRFLKSFDPKHSDKTVCTNLQDLVQKYGEKVTTASPTTLRPSVTS